MQEEIWKDVLGYEGLYIVSNLGNVKSCDRDFIRKDGNRHKRKGTSMSICDRGNGYKYICVCNNGKIKNVLIHRLVWSAFNGEIKKGFVIDHINRDKADNNLINLRECTQKENGMNRGANKNGSIRYKGVSVRNKTWFRMGIRRGEDHISLSFKDPIDAAVRYDIEATKTDGEYALTNKSLGLLTKKQIEESNPYDSFKPRFGYRGVNKPNKMCEYYRAHIIIDKKDIYSTGFRTPLEAAVEYDKMAIEVFGKDAITNKELKYL